ncbi:MAG: GatB/YqeY domain-containing protein [Nitrospirae bacterium]|nr:GatB/YqeY domain-containing protein [Nitrospirota bacterium]MBI3593876.1 GatB/YqeY domain-containing protein [Nitrospirota bacterium]
MSDLKTRLTEEMKLAMKNGDALKLSVIRMLRSSIKNKEIERGKGSSLNDQEVMEVIVSGLKQRHDSIEQFAKGNREDLVAQEKKEVEILKAFLPLPLSEGEVKNLIHQAILETGAVGMKDMGKVMKALMPRILGRTDNALVSKIVKESLSA